MNWGHLLKIAIIVEIANGFNVQLAVAVGWSVSHSLALSFFVGSIPRSCSPSLAWVEIKFRERVIPMLACWIADLHRVSCLLISL